MSQENVEIARATMEAFNRRDWDSMFEEAASTFEFDMSRAIGPTNRAVHGLEEGRQVVADFAGTFVSARWEPHEYIEIGPHVIVPWTAHFTGRDGIEVQARAIWTFTIRGRVVERVCLYQDRQEALEAAGVSE